MCDTDRKYLRIPLIGGPKDGHEILVRFNKKKGKAFVRNARSYKARNGKQAWYRFDAYECVYWYVITIPTLEDLLSENKKTAE